MKITIKLFCAKLLVLSTFWISVSNASPLVTLSENSAIYFTGEAKVSSDSNVTFDAQNELEDTIFEVTPGFEWVTGNPDMGSLFTLSASYGIRRYVDNDQFDTEMPMIHFLGQFQSAKSVSEVTASYVESQTNSRIVILDAQLLESAVTSLGFKSDYEATQKTSVVAGISYDNTDRSSSAADYSALSIPVNVYYASTEKLDVGLGYRYRSSSVDGGILGDRSSHFLNVGLRGEFSPKIIGDLKVGFLRQDVDGGDDFSGLGFDASLTYLPNEKATIVGTISKDYSVGFQGDVVDNTTASVDLNYMLNQQFEATATFAYLTDNYESTGREDDFTYVKFGLSYLPVSYMSVVGEIILQNNDSTLSGASFDGNVMSLSVDVRY